MKISFSLIKDIVVHSLLMVLVAVFCIISFFQVVLPIMTRHGESIIVPSLIGLSVEEAEVLLKQRNLRLFITEESAYLPEYPPMTVLEQQPKPNAGVKPGRKIYLTLNSLTPPQVAMPNLVDGSVRNAKALLTNKGLLLGHIRYVPDIAQNAVLAQYYMGDKIAPGELVGRGSKIDLTVGAGLSKKRITVPSVLGLRLEEAELLLLSTGVKLGNIAYKAADIAGSEPGTVLKQVPEADEHTPIGSTVDLWLVARPEEEETNAKSGILF